MKKLCFLFFPFVLFYSERAPRRAHHALVYDEVKRVVLMTTGSTPKNGGSSFIFFNDVWAFDGKEWKSAGFAGDKRSGARLIYNTRLGKIFSFGGFSGDSVLSDLRVMEDNNWRVISYLPEMKSSDPGFAYDESRDRMILFGGSPARGAVLSDTWEWDGKSWSKFSGGSPEPRQSFAMIYDSKRKRTVLFGGMGKSPSELFNDTWEYNGVSWTKVANDGPPASISPGYAYDEKRGLMMIFAKVTGRRQVKPGDGMEQPGKNIPRKVLLAGLWVI